MPADRLGPLVLVVEGRVYATRAISRDQAREHDTAREQRERWT
jgi:hypothetical protein